MSNSTGTDGQLPSFAQVAIALKEWLYEDCDEEPEWEDGKYDWHHAATMTWDEFRRISRRIRHEGSFCEAVRKQAWDIGIMVAFGRNAVFVSTDDNILPDGLGS